jgi:NAD-dependent SIR2 family protein deacetylase
MRSPLEISDFVPTRPNRVHRFRRRVSSTFADELEARVEQLGQQPADSLHSPTEETQHAVAGTVPAPVAEATGAGAAQASSLPSSRKIDGETCIFAACKHANPAIGTEDTCIRVAVPSKKLSRMSKARKEALAVRWDPQRCGFFHQDCWQHLEAAAARPSRKRGAAAGAAALSADDVMLINEVVETCEIFEPLASMLAKAKQFADLLRASKHVVSFTGAGISAAAGIPTYRGAADGIDVIAAVGGAIDTSGEHPEPTSDTAPLSVAEDSGAQSATKREADADTHASKSKRAKGDGSKDKAAAEAKGSRKKKQEEDPAIAMSEEYLKLQPTRAHRALMQLMKEGLMHFVITQNCDNLHMRSGIPREKMAELHGNVFVEYCEKCKSEYVRPYCVDLFSTDCAKEKWFVECPTCHFGHYTGRRCEKPGCHGKLKDTIVNFGDDLHDKVLGGLALAEDMCRAADVVLCLGSSLTVTPASELPTLLSRRGSIVICNLQATYLDSNPAVAVRVYGGIDQFMLFVLHELGLPLP